MTRHRKTDPGCRFHRPPRTRWGDRRSRGRPCRVCHPPRPITPCVAIACALREDGGATRLPPDLAAALVAAVEQYRAEHGEVTR